MSSYYYGPRIRARNFPSDWYPRRDRFKHWVLKGVTDERRKCNRLLRPFEEGDTENLNDLRMQDLNDFNRIFPFMVENLMSMDAGTRRQMWLDQQPFNSASRRILDVGQYMYRWYFHTLEDQTMWLLACGGNA